MDFDECWKSDGQADSRLYAIEFEQGLEQIQMLEYNHWSTG